MLETITDNIVAFFFAILLGVFGLAGWLGNKHYSTFVTNIEKLTEAIKELNTEMKNFDKKQSLINQDLKSRVEQLETRSQ